MQRRKLTRAERDELDREALDRARGGNTCQNDAECIRAFSERGIPEDEILPRENVLTFNAWRALGRYVRKGEKGVRLTVWVTRDDPEQTDGEGEPVKVKRAVSAFVFHISQTEAREARDVREV